MTMPCHACDKAFVTLVYCSPSARALHGAVSFTSLENAGNGSSEKDEALRSAKLRLSWGHSFTLEMACFRFDIRNTDFVHSHVSRKSAPGSSLKGRWDFNSRMFRGEIK